MNDLIRKIMNGEDLEQTVAYVLKNLYTRGPISTTDMEIISYMTLYQPAFFNRYVNSVLNYMGLFFKDAPRETLAEAVFGQYRKYLSDKYHQYYTPIQGHIIKGIDNNKCFSFSAPTSTGKSFVFIKKLISCEHDAVVIVPSRALINEYFLKLSESIEDRTVNILTFIDRINTRYARKNIFIVTPERCRELFRQKESFQVELFLFDEAQLSDEESKRGLYYDSIVRRCRRSYPEAKFVFAHPFVRNPESQIQKNHFDLLTSSAIQYTQKSVGQIFLCLENDTFFHFGIEKSLLGSQKQKCDFNPIESTIRSGGTVLFYLSKSKIYNKSFLNDFARYIDLCTEVINPKIDYYVDQLKSYCGGDTIANKNHYSQIIALLKRGIVIHHGSLPLKMRLLIEQYTKEGLCRICFATSTLEQGINMPFDVVYLDRLELSKPLAVKNLIGRAGRSTPARKFDFGYVIINAVGKMAGFRKLMSEDVELDNVSALEKDEIFNDEYIEFKDAIINDTFSDEYNLTEKDLVKLTSEEIEELLRAILDLTFYNDTFLALNQINGPEARTVFSTFAKLYSAYLGRDLFPGEQNVFETAIRIILWRVHGKTFKNICWYRYSYVSRSNERAQKEKLGQRTDDLQAAFLTGFNDIPDKTLKVFSRFAGTKAADIDYDLIMYDTYDYIDKLIGFKLSDIFYAAFIQYFQRTQDSRAERLAKLIKYGTDNPRYIWLLRYGLSFEEIEVLDAHIVDVSAENIVFNPSIYDVPESDRTSINRFLND